MEFNIEIPTWVWVVIIVIFIFFLPCTINKYIKNRNKPKEKNSTSKKNINYGINKGNIGDVRYDERK